VRPGTLPRPINRRSTSESLFIEIAQDFEHLPPLVGICFAAFLGALGFVMARWSPASPVAALGATLGHWAAWLLAFLVLVYTLKGVIGRTGDGRLISRTARVTDLDPYEFERYVAAYYRLNGWSVTPRGGRTPDGGVDLLVKDPDGSRHIVQCKHWKARRVGVRPVRELVGVVVHERVDGAIFITSGSYTPEAKAFARGKALVLVDGDRLGAMVQEVRKTGANDPPRVLDDPVPSCPLCGAQMLLRTATRGANAGRQFWGCSTYPACRGIAPIASQEVVSASR